MHSAATDLDAPDVVDRVGGLRRDTTTLVMQAHLSPGLRLHDGVVRVSAAEDLDAAMKELFAVEGPALLCVDQDAELL